jgi:hypothetical protein
MKDTMSIASLKPAIAEMERILKLASRLCESGGEAVVVVPVIQTRGRKKRCSGWFELARWSTRDGQLRAELTLAAETLNRDLVDIAHTLIHEAVHVANAKQGIKDCAGPRNDRHNAKFKEAAEKIGLVCKEPIDSYGWGYTELSDELRKRIVEEWKPDASKWDLFRVEDTVKTKTSRQKSYVCECNVKVRVAKGTDLDATCHDCDTKFELVT